MTCRELTEAITHYLEGRMPLFDRLRFRAHIGMCRDCRVYLDQMRQTMRALGTLPPDAISPEARARLLERFRDWKR